MIRAVLSCLGEEEAGSCGADRVSLVGGENADGDCDMAQLGRDTSDFGLEMSKRLGELSGVLERVSIGGETGLVSSRVDRFISSFTRRGDNGLGVTGLSATDLFPENEPMNSPEILPEA